jgi:uncharacterized protein (DUF1697 family)
MEDLKRIFESIGPVNVETCVQSRHVIFESKEDDPALLDTQIERQVERATGCRIQPFVRTMREVKSIAN